jgi:hypothetical protein
VWDVLSVTVFSVVRPDWLAQVNDIVALFKDQPSSETWRDGFERQVSAFLSGVPCVIVFF